MADAPEIEAAAAIVGVDVDIDGQVLWAQALVPVPGIEDTVRPVITEGREPLASDEVALGAITMRNLGVGVGDTVKAQTTTSEAAPSSLTVVGTALINDSYEGSAGLGAVVTAEWLAEFAPEETPDPYVLRLRPGADVSAFRTELEQAFPGQVNGPVKQMAIRNVERIRYLPTCSSGWCRCWPWRR